MKNSIETQELSSLVYEFFKILDTKEETGYYVVSVQQYSETYNYDRLNEIMEKMQNIVNFTTY